MQIEKQEEKENPLLHRNEITVKIKNYAETPSRTQVKEKASAELGYDKQNLVIDKISQEYGKKEATCTIKAYENQEDMERYSKSYKKERTQKTQEKDEEVEEETEETEEEEEQEEDESEEETEKDEGEEQEKEDEEEEE